MTEQGLRHACRDTEWDDASHPDGSEATADEGIRLLKAFRAIYSPDIRARILALVVTEARRGGGRPPH